MGKYDVNECQPSNTPVIPINDQILALFERIRELEQHKRDQIEENRKISRRVDKLEEKKCPLCNCKRSYEL